MEKTAKIYVAGHRGLAGSAIVTKLREQGYGNLLLRSHAELDLTDQAAVRAFFDQEKPEYVFLAAAKVGGILANDTYPAEFIHQNLAIQTNVIHESWRTGVKRLLYLGSSCVYPRECPQPIKEEYLLTGPLEPTNRPYALAKIAGIEMCWSYNRQYDTNYLAVMPTNLYGAGEHYDLHDSHVLPALMRKVHEAKKRGEKEVVVWGTGAARREFLYSGDMAGACVFLMTLPATQFSALVTPKTAPLINIGSGEELTIRELAEVMMRVVELRGHLVFDASKPDGTPRKVLDTSRLSALGWKPEMTLLEGIGLTYKEYLSRFG
ncbi:MAG: GDP-L-fucose synthase [Betaproteobacteria bacterium]|nr:GDP-L-fucose synthase [Betaproteobacteria bacterium]